MSVYSAKAAASTVDDPTGWPSTWDFPPTGGNSGPWPPGFPPTLPSTDRYFAWAYNNDDAYVTYSDDTGATWTSKAIDFNTATKPFAMVGTANLIYCFGVDNAVTTGEVSVSLDGGTTWDARGTFTVSSGATTRPIIVADTVLLCESGDYVVRSTDGGATWTEISVGAAYGKTTGLVELSNDDVLAFAGNTGAGALTKVYKSTDDGATFGSAIGTITHAGATGTATAGVRVCTNGNIVCVERHSLWLSTDSGVNWTAKTPGSDTYYAIEASGNNVLVSGNAAFYYSSDGGSTWSTGDASNMVTTAAPQAIWAHTDGWIFGKDTAVMYSSTGLTGFAAMSGTPTKAVVGCFVLEA